MRSSLSVVVETLPDSELLLSDTVCDRYSSMTSRGSCLS